MGQNVMAVRTQVNTAACLTTDRMQSRVPITRNVSGVEGCGRTQQVTTSVLLSTSQRNDSQTEKNSVQVGPMGPPTLETVAPVHNFTFSKAVLVSPQHLHCSV